MLTDTLIATVLGLPEEVRVALLSVPGNGFWIRAKSYGLSPSVVWFDAPPPARETDKRDFWMPSDSLAILSAACALYNRAHLGDVPLWPTATKVPVDLWRLGLTGRREDEPAVFADHVDPVVAAVEVLREVCRG